MNPVATSSPFLRDGPARLEAMRAAVSDGDREGLRRQACALRRSSALAGASAVAELCELLERPQDGVASAVLVDRLAEACARTVEPVRPGLP